MAIIIGFSTRAQRCRQRLVAPTAAGALAACLLACSGSSPTTEDQPPGAGGAGGSSGVVSTGPLPEWCVDIEVPVDAGSGGRVGTWANFLARTSSGLHVAWRQTRPVDDDTSRPHLGLSTFDPDTGDHLRTRILDIIPPDPDPDDYRWEAGLRAFGWAPNGSFALAFYYGPTTTDRQRELYVGHVDDETVSHNVVFETSHIARFINWDGEAFTIHREGAGEMLLERVGPDGQHFEPVFVNKPQGFGYGPLGFRSSTNPTSGATYMFAATGDRGLAAHKKDGSFFDWMPDGFMWLEQAGATPVGSEQPAVSVDPDGGAWIAWDEETSGGPRDAMAQHVSVDGTLGPAFIYEPAGDITGTLPKAIHARSPRQAWAVNAGRTIRVVDLDGTDAAPPQILTKPTDGNSGSAFPIVTLEHDNERWVAFRKRQKAYIRVLKVAPDCLYPAL